MKARKFVSIQKTDVKFDETTEDKKRFSKLKNMCKPLIDWWKDELSDFTGGVIPRILASRYRQSPAPSI